MRTFSVLASLAVAACTAGTSTSDEPEKVVDGRPDYRHGSVVALTRNTEGSRSGTEPSLTCSGTLITSGVVLTAAHCERDTKYVFVGDNVLRRDGAFEGPRYLEVDGRDFAIHPDAAYDDPATAHHDIALLRLPERVTDIEPQPLPRECDASLLGAYESLRHSERLRLDDDDPRKLAWERCSDLTIVGWGCNAVARTMRDRHGNVVAYCPAGWGIGTGERLYSSERFEEYDDRGLFVTHNTSVGDSGGPALAQGELIGVASTIEITRSHYTAITDAPAPDDPDAVPTRLWIDCILDDWDELDEALPAERAARCDEVL